MEPSTANIIPIISVIIAVLVLLFGIFTHFRTHKVAKLTYKVSQLSDFDVPPDFLDDLPRAPVAITITSLGNKGTENIVLNLSTKSKIDGHNVNPNVHDIRVEGQSLELNVEKLNPSQKLELFLRCTGSPWENQVQEISLSHSEGAAQDEGTVNNLVFDFFGLEIEYDLKKLQTHLNRIGPIRIRSTD